METESRPTIIHHEVNLFTGEHRQWVVEEDGTKREIFKGDEEWEE